MAITVIQTATYASGSSQVTSVNFNTSSAATAGSTALGVLVSSQRPTSMSLANTATLGTLLVQTGSNPTITIYRLTNPASPTYITLTAAFPSNTYASAYIIETNALSVSQATLMTGGSSPISGTGSTPPYWAPLTGDLPYTFFGFANRVVTTAQSGWTEVANLNNTSGYSAQLEVQQGPATTTTPQNVTGQVSWTGTTTAVGALVIFSSEGPYSMTSQDALESLGTDTANARLSQDAVEAVSIDTPNVRLSQEAVEPIGYDTAYNRVSQVVLEVIIPLYVRVSQDVLESLGTDTAKVHVSQNVAEVLFSSQGARRRTVDDEFLIL